MLRRSLVLTCSQVELLSEFFRHSRVEVNGKADENLLEVD